MTKSAQNQSGRKMPHETVWQGLEARGFQRLEHDRYEETEQAVGEIYDRKQSQSSNFWDQIDRNGPGIFVRIDIAGALLEQKFQEDQITNRTQYSRDRLDDAVTEYVNKINSSIDGLHTFADREVKEGVGHRIRYAKGPRSRAIPSIVYQEIAETLCDLLNTHIRPKTAPPLKPYEFLHKPFLEKPAADLFRAWLKGAPDHSEVDLDRYRHVGRKSKGLTFHAETEPRETLLNSLSNWLGGSDQNTKMVRNVYAPTSWSGLSALAENLLNRDWSSNGQSLRPLCIPVVTEGQQRSQFSYSQILSLLLAFTRKDPYPEIIRPLESHIDPGDALLEVRKRLASDPAFIVFLGFGERRNGVYETMRVIRDDHTIATLIPSLLEPPTVAFKGTLDIDIWRRNRFLLLSNEDIANTQSSRHELSSYYPQLSRYRELNLIHPPSDQLPPAPDGKTAEILDSHAYRNINLFHQWRTDESNFLRGQTSENVFRTLDALVSVALSNIRPKEKSADDTEPEDPETVLAKLLENLENRYETSSEAGDSSTACLQICVQELLARLESHDPIWALSLKMIAETPGGLQVDTLQRLLFRFAESADDDLSRTAGIIKEHYGPPSQQRRMVLDELETMLSVLSSILSVGRAQDFPSRSNDVVASEGERPQGTLMLATAGHAIEFTLPDVRDEIVRLLHNSEKERPLAQVINFILAEESLRQNTSAIVEFERHDTGQARQQRRLVQAIFHGLCAIQPSESGDGLAPISIKRWNGVLSPKPETLWRELFLIHYRETLERPGEWRIARVLARDQLKLELLFGFLKPWKLKQHLPPGIRNSAQIFEFLTPDEVTKKARDMIAVSEHQACAALNLNSRLPLNPSANPDASQGATQKRNKYEIDRLILGLDQKSAIQLIAGMINRAIAESAGVDLTEEQKNGSASTPAAKSLAKTVIKFGKIAETLISEENFESTDSQNVCINEDAVRLIMNDALNLTASARRQLVNALNRAAECLAVVAESQRGTHGLEPGTKTMSKPVRRRFATAFAAFEMSEIIRRSTFEAFPFSGEHTVSGHATRGAIRLALILERESCHSMSEENLKRVREEQENLGQFGRYAERMKEELIRSLGRFPRERASIFILEAAMLRILEEYRHKDGALELARDYIERAEAILISMSAASRVRLRFLLERAKLHREIALTQPGGDPEKTARSFQAAKHDLDSLKNLSQQLDLQLWQQIADIQIKKLETVMGKEKSKEKRKGG